MVCGVISVGQKKKWRRGLLGLVQQRLSPSSTEKPSDTTACGLRVSTAVVGLQEKVSSRLVSQCGFSGRVTAREALFVRVPKKISYQPSDGRWGVLLRTSTSDRRDSKDYQAQTKLSLEGSRLEVFFLAVWLGVTL